MRCSKCLIPSTVLGSNFNQLHECRWCQENFPHYAPKGAEKLSEILEQYSTHDGPADCLVGVSGGKDSSYALLELTTTFNKRVEAFTYIHEGSTAHPLENAKRICQNLGVKHHIISLPNQTHLSSFKTFFQEWLRCPTIISASMTCVACKHLHLLGVELAHQRKIPMIVWAMSPFEIFPHKNYRRDGLMANAYNLGKELIFNPRLCQAIAKHSSTCFHGCLAFKPSTRYLKLRFPTLKHLNFFDYCDWNPSKMFARLTEKPIWRQPEDLVSEWHSDCTFHVLKEYMFQKMLGISYIDSYLSNQIRHGLMTRSEAMDILIKNKQFYAKELPKALDFIGLGHLYSEIDPSVFDISEDG